MFYLHFSTKKTSLGTMLEKFGSKVLWTKKMEVKNFKFEDKLRVERSGKTPAGERFWRPQLRRF